MLSLLDLNFQVNSLQKVMPKSPFLAVGPEDFELIRLSH